MNSYTSTSYYWKTLSKDQLTEEYVQEEADAIIKEGKMRDDRTTVEDNLHRLSGFGDVLNNDEEYVGTLYETEDDVIIVTKKTETNYIDPKDSFYTDPNNPDPFG